MEVMRMVYNEYIKCSVCGTVTRVRLQIGWLKQHPINVTCGKCGVSLKGVACIDQISIGISLKFENAEKVKGEAEEEFIVECSGEFPGRKQQKVDKNKNFEFLLSPFIQSTMRMGKNFEQFNEKVTRLVNVYYNWTNIKRIFDLYKNDNDEYFIQEIHKYLPKEQFPCSGKLEKLRAMHMIEVGEFISTLRPNIIQEAINKNLALRFDRNQLLELIDFLNSHKEYRLLDMQNAIFKVIDKFVEIFLALIPAYSLEFIEEGVLDLEIYGSTTSDFESVKDFYLSAYETLGNLLVIPVALNNISNRSSYDSMMALDEHKNINSLEEFMHMQSKANRYHFCVDSEEYTQKLFLNVNSKIRNAIGHDDVKYDSISQKITYIPNPKKREASESMYLLEFEKDILNIFEAILEVDEMLYMLMKIDLLQQGEKLEVFDWLDNLKHKKIGRNEKCPCGSGLKYKFCHGR